MVAPSRPGCLGRVREAFSSVKYPTFTVYRQRKPCVYAELTQDVDNSTEDRSAT